MRETTGKRIRQLMAAKGLKQVDILNMCSPYCLKYNVKLAKNDLSQYINDKVQPKQDKLSVLGMALNVSEAWLMGFDVPMERQAVEVSSSSDLRPDEAALLSNYNRLNSLGKDKVNEYVSDLLDNEKYLSGMRLDVG